MAGRQNKVGLDYFELDCHMDDKVELIEAEYGLKGFAILVKLYQSIYSEFGYYCEWTPDLSVLWARRLGVSHSVGFGDVGKVDDNSCALPGFPNNLINNVIAALIRRNIFSDRLLKKYGILTSSGVQKQYLKATVKREVVNLKKEYLLIPIPENRKNVVVNSISDVINSISDIRNEQSRVEKSRVENKTNAHSAEVRGTESLESFYESIWKLYPLKKGKGAVSKTQKKVLQRIGFDELERCVNRYVTEIKEFGKEKYVMHGSTFFNSGYVDYLDKNYKGDKLAEKKDVSVVEELVGDDW